jgi:hypothetical protein
MGGEPVREVVPVTAEDENTRAHLVRLHAVAVELHLVQPDVAGRDSLGGEGAARCNEAECGHAFAINEPARDWQAKG